MNGTNTSRRQVLRLPEGMEASLQKVLVAGRSLVQLTIRDNRKGSTRAVAYHVEAELRRVDEATVEDESEGPE
jgi:hypothetical protein